MIPWLKLDTTKVPGGAGEELRLMQRGAEFSIMCGANELMNSRLSGSEEALARLTCARLTGVAGPRLLIGGLGMGFTLRAALAALGPEARVTVAELVPAVVTWARGPMRPVFGDSLDDARVTIAVGDVGACYAAPGGWDAILLDVDNGPDGLTRAGNDALYTAAGLRRAHAGLRPGGVLSVWSSGPDRAFGQRLPKSGFAVEETRARATGRSGARHVIWLATRR